MFKDLVAILDVTFTNADYVIYIQTSIRVFFKSHCVTEYQGDGSTSSPCLDGVSAELGKGCEKGTEQGTTAGKVRFIFIYLLTN